MDRTRQCRHCGGKIEDLQTIDTSGLDGIEKAQAGLCNDCGRITCTILEGSEAAVSLARIVVEGPSRPHEGQRANC